MITCQYFGRRLPGSSYTLTSEIYIWQCIVDCFILTLRPSECLHCVVYRTALAEAELEFTVCKLVFFV